MDDIEIRRYAGLMKELGLTGLEVTDGSSHIRLECSASVPAPETVRTVSAERTEQPAVQQDKDGVSVRSPLVGMFYAAPAENAEPFVSVGSSVKRGQVLCIIEAMKLMNEITAETDGIVAEICVKNGQIVEYGTELFRIRGQGT